MNAPQVITTETKEALQPALVLGKARLAPRLRSERGRLRGFGLEDPDFAPHQGRISDFGPSFQFCPKNPTMAWGARCCRRKNPGAGLVRAWRGPGAGLVRATAAAPKVHQRPASHQGAGGVFGQSCAQHRIAPLNPVVSTGLLHSILRSTQDCSTQSCVQHRIAQLNPAADAGLPGALPTARAWPGRVPAPAERRPAGRLQD